MSRRQIVQRVTEHAAEWDPARAGLRIASGKRLLLAHQDDAEGPWRASPPKADVALVEPEAGLGDLGSRLHAALSGLTVQALLLRAIETETDAPDAPAQREHRGEAFVRVESPRGAVLIAAATGAGPRALPVDALVQRLRAGVRTLEAPGGPLPRGVPVALGPEVAAPLVAGLALLLRGDTAIASGLAKNAGKRVFPAALSIVDAPAVAAPLRTRSHDDEGTRCEPVTLVQAGVLTGFLHTRATARALGVAAEGRAFLQANGAVLPSGLHLAVAPGPAALPEERVELDVRVETFTTSPRPGHVSVVAAGRHVRPAGVTPVGPVPLELPVLGTFRKLLAAGPEVRFSPAFDDVGCPWLLFEPLG